EFAPICRNISEVCPPRRDNPSALIILISHRTTAVVAVGWVERKRNPSPTARRDGFRGAQPILHFLVGEFRSSAIRSENAPRVLYCDDGSKGDMPVRSRQRCLAIPALSSASPNLQDRTLRRPSALVVQGNTAAGDGNGLRLP